MGTKFECNPRRPGKYGVEGFYEIEHLEENKDAVRDQFHLYRVRAAYRLVEGNEPKHAEVFVLAQSEQDATAQAECALSLDTLIARPGCHETVKGSVVVVAERVPFFVRGWGGQSF